MVLEGSPRLSGRMGTAIHSNLALKMKNTLTGGRWVKQKKKHVFFIGKEGNLSCREFAVLSGELSLLIYH